MQIRLCRPYVLTSQFVLSWVWARACRIAFTTFALSFDECPYHTVNVSFYEMLTPIKVESKTSLCSSMSVTWSLPITLVASSPSLSLYVRIAPNTAQSLHSRDPVELLVPCEPSATEPSASQVSSLGFTVAHGVCWGGSPHGSNQSGRGKVRGGRSKRAASASRLMRSLFQMCVGYFVLLDSSRW